MKLSDRFERNSSIDRLSLSGNVKDNSLAGGVRWFGHVIKRDEGNVLEKALTFKIGGL